MRRPKAFTLVEVMMAAAIFAITLVVILSLTKVSAESFRSGLLRSDFADQARRLNLAFARDCTGPTFWQILDNYADRRPGVASSGTCLVLAYTNNLDKVVPENLQNGDTPSPVRITRVVCYYLDTEGRGPDDHRALRRIDSAEPRAGVRWPSTFELDASRNLRVLLPVFSGEAMRAGTEIAKVHVAQPKLASAANYQLFYARAGGAGVTLNALLRYGSDFESLIAPVRFTTPVLR